MMTLISRIEFKTAFFDTNVLINILLKNKDDKTKKKMNELISLVLNWKKPIQIVITNVLITEFLYKVIRWEKSKRLITEKGYFLSEISKEDLYNEVLEREFKNRIRESLSNLFYYVINFSSPCRIEEFCINKEVLNFLISDLELDFQDAFLVADLTTSLYSNDKIQLDFFFTSDNMLLKKLNFLRDRVIKTNLKNGKNNKVIDILSVLRDTLFINPTTSKGLGKLREEVEKIKDIREEDRIPELERFKRLFQFSKWHE